MQCFCLGPMQAQQYGELQPQLTSEEEKAKDNDEGVAKVEKDRSKVFQFKFVKEIVYAEEEEVHGSESRGEERSPPPAIVLWGIRACHL